MKNPLETMEPRDFWEKYRELESDALDSRQAAYRLRDFRRAFRPQTAFVQCTVRLQELGFDPETARWAAGQATSRLDEGALFAEVLEMALTILEEYRRAA